MLAEGTAPGISLVLSQGWSASVGGGRELCGTPLYAQGKEESVGLMSIPRLVSGEAVTAGLGATPSSGSGRGPAMGGCRFLGLGGLPQAMLVWVG